jgi:hypothetical protein
MLTFVRIGGRHAGAAVGSVSLLLPLGTGNGTRPPLPVRSDEPGADLVLAI